MTDLADNLTSLGSELIARASKGTDETSALSPSLAAAEADACSAEDHYTYLSIHLFEHRSGVQSKSGAADARAKSSGVGGADL